MTTCDRKMLIINADYDNVFSVTSAHNDGESIWMKGTIGRVTEVYIERIKNNIWSGDENV